MEQYTTGDGDSEEHPRRGSKGSKTVYIQLPVFWDGKSGRWPAFARMIPSHKYAQHPHP